MLVVNRTLVLALITISILVAAGPTIVCLAQALVPLIVAVGLTAAVVRIVWFYTRRW